MFVSVGLDHMSVSVTCLCFKTVDMRCLSSTLLFAAAGGSSPGQMLTLQASPQGNQPLSLPVSRAAVHFSLTQSYINVESVQDGSGFG